MSSDQQGGSSRPNSDANSTAGSRVRLGVLTDGLCVPLWVHNTIDEIRRTGHLDVSLLICTSAGKLNAEPPPAILLRLWNWADQRLFRPSVDALAFWRQEYLIDTVVVKSPENGGGKHILSEDELMKINAANLDIILHFGSAVLWPQILNCARYGIWTFLSKTDGTSQDDCTQFWDLYEGIHVSALTLRALTVDGEHDLYHSTFSNDTLSLYRNRNATCWRKSQILLGLLADPYRKGWSALQRSNTSSAIAPLGEQRRTGPPGNAVMTRFLARWSARTMRRWLSNRAFSEQWFIAYHDKRPNVDRRARLRIIKPPTRSNYADPFLYEKCGRHYIFFEGWSIYRPKGEIWVVGSR